MANKIIFGADLIEVLKKEYKLNKLGEVPTKYKNGVTTIDFIYGKEKGIDDLKYNKPYVEFSIDDETDGFISGTMYLNGGVEGIQFDSWEDLKYFMKNAKWTESKKSARKSLKEKIMSLNPSDLCDILKSYEDVDTFDLINHLEDAWDAYRSSWTKFNHNYLEKDFWGVVKKIEKLNSFDKRCNEIINAWEDDIEQIFYSDYSADEFDLNYGFQGNDIF